MSNIGLYSINRPEWILSEQACYANNFVTVPLYDTLGDEAIVFIFEQTEMEAVVIDIKKVPIIRRLKDKLRSLKRLIVMDSCSDCEDIKVAKQDGFEVLFLTDLEAKGSQDKGFKVKEPKPSDLATICYTSGTTGLPKGAMLAHETLIAAIGGALFLLGHNEIMSNKKPVTDLECPGEVYLSFLPLAHIFERVVFNSLFVIGFKIGFYQGDVTKILGDLEALQPTFFVAVPRLFNRVHDKIIAGIEAKGGIAKFLFNHALSTKLVNFKKNGRLHHWLWDRLVFNAVRAKLGGKVKVMLTGSAPLSPQVMDFLRVVFCCDVFEGYGMTELSAVTAVTHRGDYIPGQVGGPVPSIEVKLVDIPEMGYTSKDKPFPRGEIWSRGPTLFKGYYKNDEATKANVDSDGWLATGDVGMFDEKGRLFIIDRKKALFKLSQGEYISPEKIEAILARCPMIAQAFVDGDSLKSYLVAVVVPDQEIVEPWAKSNGIPGSFSELCKNDLLKGEIMKSIIKLGANGSGELKGFEVPKDIFLEQELFSVDNDLITPTFKLKRAITKKKYHTIIEQLIAAVDSQM